MNTPLPSDIKILDRLLALNLTISLWSARKKLALEDFGNVELPPEDLATLGSKRIAPPESLRVFSALKARAFNFLDRHGVRFMSGWAIPEEKAAEILQELVVIREEFEIAKTQFLTEYDKTISDWITKHARWRAIIADSIVSPDYVRARMDFKWQLFRVAPFTGQDEAPQHAGLAEEVEGLGNTLFGEISRSATEIWNRVYAGKNEVTHKALSLLRTLHGKLLGLSFVEPHVAPVADILQLALSRVPKRGNISGPDLLALQGIVCLLRDTPALIQHAEAVIQNGSASALDALLQSENVDNASDPLMDFTPEDDMPFVAVPLVAANIPSLGLW